MRVFRRLPRQLLLAGLLVTGTVRTGIQAQDLTDRPIDLWRKLQVQLTSDQGAAFFKQVQDCEVPPENRRFEGPVVSQPSAAELIVNVDNAKGDAKLKFDHALKNVNPGTYVYFKGVVKSYAKEPYQLTFEVDDGDVVGLASK
jgi:hypothetical protein